MFWLIGCTPDAWDQTILACDASEQACEQQMMRDFGVVQDYPEAERKLLLEATSELLTWDLGPWPPCSSEPEVLALVQVLEPVPGEDSTQKVYNFVAQAVDHTELAPEDADFSFHFSGGLLQVRPGGFRYDWASALLHEASHSLLPPHDICMDGYDCDRDWIAPYGVQAGVSLLALEHCEEVPEGSLMLQAPVSCERLSDTWEVVRDRVRPL